MFLRYDGPTFIENLERSIEIRLNKNKEPRQIRYFHYASWALALRKKEIGPMNGDELPIYSYPQTVLKFIRAVVPGDIVGEIKDEAYPISLQEFCAGLDIPKNKES